MNLLAPMLTAYAVMVGSSLILYALAVIPFTAKYFLGFSDTVKRIIHLGFALAIAVVASKVGGVLGAEAVSFLTSLLISVGAVLSGGVVYRVGRTQPSE